MFLTPQCSGNRSLKKKYRPIHYHDHETEENEVMVGTYRKYGRKENCITSFSQTILREETVLKT
jgi:hypothetical protein